MSDIISSSVPEGMSVVVDLCELIEILLTPYGLVTYIFFLVHFR